MKKCIFSRNVVKGKISMVDGIFFCDIILVKELLLLWICLIFLNIWNGVYMGVIKGFLEGF